MLNVLLCIMSVLWFCCSTHYCQILLSNANLFTLVKNVQKGVLIVCILITWGRWIIKNQNINTLFFPSPVATPKFINKHLVLSWCICLFENGSSKFTLPSKSSENEKCIQQVRQDMMLQKKTTNCVTQWNFTKSMLDN